jgi:hypothetical protein
MIVSALLAAAAAIVAAPPPKPCPIDGRFEVSDRSPALLLRPEDRRGAAGAQTLASLPPANMELTVIRSVDGCSVSTVVREKVQGDGRFAKPR